MENAFNTWSQDLQDLNLSSAQFSLRPRATFPFFGNFDLHQGFGPRVSCVMKEAKEKFQEGSSDLHQETNRVRKKFIMFDQSGDQTTLMYGLGVGPSPACYQFRSLNNQEPQFVAHTVCVDNAIEENDSKSELHEDTEELNALLYSDDEDDDDDEEETSTGHSPSSMMVGSREQKREIELGEQEEVASSGGPLKRRKKEDVDDTASSGKSGINCSGNVVFEEEYDNFSSGNKKLRIEKIKETVNLLQNLIPGDKNGKNPIMIIDESINYLRSLKVKAKALGLGSF